jgi:hypothetical protein
MEMNSKHKLGWIIFHDMILFLQKSLNLLLCLTNIPLQKKLIEFLKYLILL